MSTLKAPPVKDIKELKAFKAPPSLVIQIFKGILIVFNNPGGAKSNERDIWTYGQKLLADANCLKLFEGYKQDQLTPETYQQLSDHLEKNKDIYNIDKVKKVSMPAQSFSSWLTAVHAAGPGCSKPS